MEFLRSNWSNTDVLHEDGNLASYISHRVVCVLSFGVTYSIPWPVPGMHMRIYVCVCVCVRVCVIQKPMDIQTYGTVVWGWRSIHCRANAYLCQPLTSRHLSRLSFRRIAPKTGTPTCKAQHQWSNRSRRTCMSTSTCLNVRNKCT